MYRILIRRVVRQAFRDLSAGRFAHHVDRRFAPDGALRIHGPVEFAGSFSGRDAIKQGLERLRRALPMWRFDIHEIWVRGLPGRVRVAVAWSNHAQTPTGAPLRSHGMNWIQIGWKGVVEEHVFIVLEPDEAKSSRP